MIELATLLILVIFGWFCFTNFSSPQSEQTIISRRARSNGRPNGKVEKKYTPHEYAPPKKPLSDGRVQPPASSPYFIGKYGPLAKERGKTAIFSISSKDMIVIPTAEFIKNQAAYAYAQIEYLKEAHEFMINHEKNVTSARAVMKDVRFHLIDVANIYLGAIAEADRWHNIPKSRHARLWKPSKPVFEDVMAAADIHPEPVIRQHAWVLHYAKKVWSVAQTDATNIKCLSNRDTSASRSTARAIAQDSDKLSISIAEMMRRANDREDVAKKQFLTGKATKDFLKRDRY